MKLIGDQYSAAASAATIIDPGAGKRINVHWIQVSADTATDFAVFDGTEGDTTRLLHLKAQTGAIMHFDPPYPCDVASILKFTGGATSVVTWVNVGYTVSQ